MNNKYEERRPRIFQDVIARERLCTLLQFHDSAAFQRISECLLCSLPDFVEAQWVANVPGCLQWLFPFGLSQKTESIVEACKLIGNHIEKLISSLIFAFV